MFPEPGTRISVVGTSGSGKSTLSRWLAQHRNLQHIELDALFHGPNWTTATDEEFTAKVEQALAGDHWVVDGNYSRVRPLIQSRIDTLIWLDYPHWVPLNRIIRRTFWRALTQQKLWNGNVERWNTFLTKDGMIYWVWTSHHRRKSQTLEDIAAGLYQEKTIIRLQSPRQTRAFMKGLLHHA
jgi:adenylate kinase family enzyme